MTPNRLYPGKPNYRGPTSGYFTLLHHCGPLVEWSDNVMERVEYIKSNKAAHEIPVRLRHIVFVPQPKALRKADADWQKAYADKLLAYLHKHVKDCKWDGKEIVFKDAP